MTTRNLDHYAIIVMNGGNSFTVKKTNNKHFRKNKKIALIVALVMLAIACVFAYQLTRRESPDLVQGRPSKPIQDSSASSEDPESATNQNSTKPVENSAPFAGSTSTQAEPNGLPIPILAKSSGNNGSIPPGVLINFTCTSTPGYFCEVKLEKSGANPIILEKKQLTGEMGQSFASWNWESVSGKWSVTALLSNNSGQAKSSAAQTLEVR